MHTTLARDLFGSGCNDATPDALDDVIPAVFIIDGDIWVRRSLGRLVQATGWEAETFASAEEFLSHPHSPRPSCVILNLTLPGLSGLELQKHLAGRPDLPLIFIASASHVDIPMTVQAMKAGAVEFFTGPVSELALVHATRTGIERSRAALRNDSEMRMLGERYSTLSPRERDVMALVVSGLLNKQVGFALGIAEVTVKAHRGHVMRKMKAESLPDLVNMAARLESAHGPDQQTTVRVAIPFPNRVTTLHRPGGAVTSWV